MRYFIEVSYKGTQYGGFQIQRNASTIQGEMERALSIVCRSQVNLTGSSRTDAGVHAIQNFFHFDLPEPLARSILYNINALLPVDIVVKDIYLVNETDHCRFLATARTYRYFITLQKDPFAKDTAWYYPYTVDLDLLNEAANLLYNFHDFTSFSKRNTQTFTNNCTIENSVWSKSGNQLVYNVKANRFLRGMVRGLVGTMLLVGRKKLHLNSFADIVAAKDCTKANFATPAHGLFLVAVEYPTLVMQNQSNGLMDD